MIMRRKIRSVIAALVSSIMAYSLLVSIASPAYAVTQSEIDALKAERDAISAQRREKQEAVTRLENEKADIVARKQAMDERNMLSLQQIELNDQEIVLYDQMIADKELEIVDAQKLEDEQLARYRTRVRAMEENGNLNILALILKANSLGELLTNIDDVGEIMESDKELEAAYKAARENTEKVKAEYEDFRSELNAKQDELRQEQKELEGDIEEANQLILSLENDLENRQAEYDAIMAAEDAANSVINKLVAELEEQRRQAALAASASSSGGGAAVGTASFMWPVASYVYISSRFGLRVHPITGETKSHTGLDIASNMGTTVYAADNGTITLAGWNGGYGNCIMIDHGNGYVTLYGHLSSLGVSEGQSVSKGDTIGQVGSTGNSTGPHLHFEVIRAGTRVDPEQFFSGLVISPNAGE